MFLNQVLFLVQVLINEDSRSPICLDFDRIHIPRDITMKRRDRLCLQVLLATSSLQMYEFPVEANAHNSVTLIDFPQGMRFEVTRQYNIIVAVKIM